MDKKIWKERHKSDSFHENNSVHDDFTKTPQTARLFEIREFTEEN